MQLSLLQFSSHIPNCCDVYARSLWTVACSPENFQHQHARMNMEICELELLFLTFCQKPHKCFVFEECWNIVFPAFAAGQKLRKEEKSNDRKAFFLSISERRFQCCDKISQPNALRLYGESALGGDVKFKRFSLNKPLTVHIRQINRPPFRVKLIVLEKR